jgi:hypothetical protein
VDVEPLRIEGFSKRGSESSKNPGKRFADQLRKSWKVTGRILVQTFAILLAVHFSSTRFETVLRNPGACSLSYGD